MSQPVPLTPDMLVLPSDTREAEKLGLLLTFGETPMVDRRGDKWRVWIRGYIGPKGCWKPSLSAALECIAEKLVKGGRQPRTSA